MSEILQQLPTGQDPLRTRPSLLLRIKDMEDADSWVEFTETYEGLIRSFALKAGLNPEEAQEVLQETLVGVSRKIGKFRYDRRKGFFKGWLLRLTRWRIQDQFRKRMPRPHMELNEHDPSVHHSLTEAIPDPASLDLNRVWDLEWQRNVAELALERVRHLVSPKHFQIFDLHVLKQHSVKEVENRLKVKASQIYVIKHRILDLLKEQAKYVETRLT